MNRTEGEVGGEGGEERERRNEGEGKTRTGSRTSRQKETKDREQARDIMGKKERDAEPHKEMETEKTTMACRTETDRRKEAQGAGKRGDKGSKGRGRMTEKGRDLEKRERGDREQTTIIERKRGTGKRKNYTEGKGRGQGGTGMQKRGDMHDPKGPGLTRVPALCTARQILEFRHFFLSLSLSFPPFPFHRHLTVLHLRQHIGVFQLLQHEAS